MENVIKPGMSVVFGRTHGEQTLGVVVRVNAKTVTVRQTESRGTMRDYPVGSIWRVGRSMVKPVGSSAVAVLPSAPAVKRADSVILDEISNVYGELSPENLTCDGELSGAQVRRKLAALNGRLKALCSELGRWVDESECYSIWEAQAQARRQA